MRITSEITVGNDITLGFGKVYVETTCHGFIDLHIPCKEGVIKIELKRSELREFLARTCPTFQTIETYEAEKGIK